MISFLPLNIAEMWDLESEDLLDPTCIPPSAPSSLVGCGLSDFSCVLLVLQACDRAFPGKQSFFVVKNEPLGVEIHFLS